jgi:hypothetical protein
MRGAAPNPRVLPLQTFQRCLRGRSNASGRYLDQVVDLVRRQCCHSRRAAMSGIVDGGGHTRTAGCDVARRGIHLAPHIARRSRDLLGCPTSRGRDIDLPLILSRRRGGG